MSRVVAYLPRALVAKVAAAAESEGRSVSNWLRRLVEREINGRF